MVRYVPAHLDTQLLPFVTRPQRVVFPLSSRPHQHSSTSLKPRIAPPQIDWSIDAESQLDCCSTRILDSCSRRVPADGHHNLPARPPGLCSPVAFPFARPFVRASQLESAVPRSILCRPRHCDQKQLNPGYFAIPPNWLRYRLPICLTATQRWRRCIPTSSSPPSTPEPNREWMIVPTTCWRRRRTKPNLSQDPARSLHKHLQPSTSHNRRKPALRRSP